MNVGRRQVVVDEIPLLSEALRFDVDAGGIGVGRNEFISGFVTQGNDDEKRNDDGQLKLFVGPALVK